MEANDQVDFQPKIVDGRAIFKVSGKTPVGGLSGAITRALEDGYEVELQSIGAGALNQAFKGVAKARGFIALKSRDLVVRPGFGTAFIDGHEVTTLVQSVSME